MKVIFEAKPMDDITPKDRMIMLYVSGRWFQGRWVVSGYRDEPKPYWEYYRNHGAQSQRENPPTYWAENEKD